MARDRRPRRTPPAAPGRVPRRPRSTAKTRAGTLATPLAAAGRAARNLRLPKLPNRLGLTRRALVVISMVVLLALSYANSLRIYIGQQNDLAVAQEQIRERSERISRLQDELSRWNDPAYVKAQARERLGWVVPGETGFRVLGPDGKPLGGGVVIESEQKLPPGEHPEMWFDRLWASVQTADSPKRKLG